MAYLNALPKRGLLALACAMLLSSCAAPAPSSSTRGGADVDVARCKVWFTTLDAAVEHAGVRDASQHRVAGFPYLRADRFAASLRDDATAREDAFAQWLAGLRHLDMQAREFELANLPNAMLPSLGVTDKNAALATTRDCSGRLARADLASPVRRKVIATRVVVPDDYITWKRAAGLYPIATVGFARGIEGWHRRALAMFAAARRGDGDNKIVRYGPRKAASSNGVQALFAALPRDSLGMPELDAAQRELLFDAYAPIFEIETEGGFDRFGPLTWRDGPFPAVDISRPLAYRRLAFTRYGRETLVQLVYTIWFPERPRKGAFDMLGGWLDGVVWRVTLDKDGAPLVYDTIHPCGCYHMFFPTARAKPRPGPDKYTEWAFIPDTLADMAPGQRVAVRIASSTHYVVRVRPAQPAAATAYGFAEEDSLRALPLASGGTRSAFNPKGLVSGTERGERWLFWPMGIRSSGTMRQWGKHATAFIGRRHFDDAHLIEERFALRK
jgi:hypothetical protein